MYDAVETGKVRKSLSFLHETDEALSLPRMLGAPSVHTLASLDQLSFLSLKNVRGAFKMSSPLVWPRRGSKHNISLGNLTQTQNCAISATSVLSSTAVLKHGAADTSSVN